MWALGVVTHCRSLRKATRVPCAAAEVGYDEALQMMTVKGSHEGAVRLLLKICAAESDEETAAPDTDIGLKATRRVRC